MGRVKRGSGAPGEFLHLRGAALLQSRRETWENHRNTMGKPLEYDGLMGFDGDLPSDNLSSQLLFTWPQK